MPLVDVTCSPAVGADARRRIAEALADVVPLAVECAEEPRTGPLRAGDLEIRLRDRGRDDVGELDVVVEVRTTRLASRVADAQARADLVRDRVAGLAVGSVGVWLILAEGAWSQSA